MPQRRDNAGAVCNSDMGILFLCIYFSYSCPECGIAELSLLLFVSSSWSTSTTSIICLVKLVHLKELLFHQQAGVVVERVNVKEAPKFYILSYRRLLHHTLGQKGFYQYHQKQSSYVVRRLATSRDVTTLVIRKLTTNENTHPRTHPPTHIAIH